MRVVKVVHATTADQTELEKAISVLQAYDVNEFVATHGPDIMEHCKVFNMPAPAEEDEPAGRRARRAPARVADTSALWLKCFFGLTPAGKIGYDISILRQEGEHHARSEAIGRQLD